MKVSLNDTVALAEKGVLTDEDTICEITRDLLQVPYTALEKASGMFSFVRNIIYEEMSDRFFDKLTYRGVLQIPNEYQDPESMNSRLCVIQRIAIGLLRAYSIPEVRRFLSVSVSAFVDLYCPELLIKLKESAKKNAKVYIDERMTMRTFLNKISDRLGKSWNVGSDIDEYRQMIVGSTKALDIVLVMSFQSMI